VKQFEKAAQIYMQMQQVNEALLTYLRAGDMPAAARLYASCQGPWVGGFEAAPERGPRNSARCGDVLLCQGFRPRREAFLAVNDHGKAARAYEAGGDARWRECSLQAGWK